MIYNEQFSFTGADGKQLNAVLWIPQHEIRGVMQITHGMTEHMGRWSTTAEALTAAGIAVCGYDLRGHGADVIVPGIAAFGEHDWEAALEDMHILFLQLKKRFPTLPHLMMGFSLGSFLLREYLGRYPDGITGAVLIGTGQQPGWLLECIIAIVQTQIRKAGWYTSTPLIRKLSFETYNRKFAPNRTNADWLCSDTVQLDAYLSDPMCRHDISAGLFRHLLSSMRRCAVRSSCENWDKDTPILLLSGERDPVGNMGNGVRAVQKQLHREGIKTVGMQLLPNARHDLLHEECSGAAESARAILIAWVNTCIHP